MRRLSRSLGDIKPAYDAVVVGSGYGGGVAASRLVRMGYRVALLERGLELHPGEYPDTPVKALHQLQVDGEHVGRLGEATGLFDLRLNPDMNVLVGCGLGGTSLINAGVMLKADARVFDDPCWPEGFNDDDLEEGYARATAMLSPAPYPADRPNLNKLQALETAARALGASCTRPPIAVTFQDRINQAGVSQPGCVLCGDCCSGCNVGAKNTTLMTYVADATAGGAEIYCGAPARWIERSADDRWTVAFLPQGLKPGAFEAEEVRISARIVVLAAGALGSTEILLRSRGRGLRLSARLGAGFTGNGDVLAFGYNNDRPIDGIGAGSGAAGLDSMSPGASPIGPTITGLIDLRATTTLDDGIVIEEGAIPGGLGSFLPLIMAAAARAVGRDTDAGDLLAETCREIESLTLGPYRGAVNHTQTFLVMAQDGADGEMRLREDRLRIDWPGVGSRPLYERIATQLRRAVAATGGTYVPNPVWTDLLKHRLMTVHPLGGCSLGRDGSSGVVDAECRVFRSGTGTDVYPDLYVCDGAAMPRSLGVNPLLTIAAVAERAMIRLARRENRAIDLTPRPAMPADESASAIGIRFTERMAGTIRPVAGGADSDASFVATIVVDDVERFIAERGHQASLVGSVAAKALSPEPLAVIGGCFNLFVVDPTRVELKQMRYAMPLTASDDRRYFLQGTKDIHDDRGFDLWRDTTTLAVVVHEGPDNTGPRLFEGTLRIAADDFAKQLQTITVTNAPDLAARLATMGRFGRFFAGQLFESFGGPFARPSAFDPSVVRPKRPLRVSAPAVHFFGTEDAKTLRLTRYQGGAKGPVLLLHGLGVSSLIFSIDTIETNLLEYLYAAGYDCWLLDYRASVELKHCEELSDADDVARYDYGPAVDYVCQHSGSASVQVVAHCYGAMTFTMAMLAGLPRVRSAVISQIGAHATVPWWPQRLLATLHAPDLMRAVGLAVLDARATVDRSALQRATDTLIQFFYPFRAEDRSRSLTSRRVTALYGQLYELSQLNQATLDAIPEMFGKANIAAFRHLSRIARVGHVVRADGTDDYLRESSLRNFAIPTLFIHGALNRCFAPDGTRQTLAVLSKANHPSLYERREIAETGHIDCIFGKNAARDVYPAILAHLDRTPPP